MLTAHYIYYYLRIPAGRDPAICELCGHTARATISTGQKELSFDRLTTHRFFFDRSIDRVPFVGNLLLFATYLPFVFTRYTIHDTFVRIVVALNRYAEDHTRGVTYLLIFTS